MDNVKRRELLKMGIGLAGSLAAGGLTLNAETPRSRPEENLEFRSLGITLDSPKSPFLEKAAEILSSRVQEHSGITPRSSGKTDCAVHLDIQKGIGSEGFRIESISRNEMRITGNDGRVLLYGIGKFLRSNTYQQGSLAFGSWQGTSIPDMPFREIYFATHFHNFYEEAPVSQIQRYVEDLALWGYNGVDVWFDMHQYEDLEDPAAQAMLRRLNAILKAAKALKLNAGLTLIANEAYANSPKDLRADYTIGHDGYFKEPEGNYPVDLCPNKPGAKALLLKWREGVFQAFQSVGLDHVTIWPYDQGGCTNKACAPWGANGFLTMAQPIAEMARRDFPGCKIILSTWDFDHFTSGEWKGLEAKFGNERPGWVDYVMAGDDGVLRYSGDPPKHHVPGAFPLLSFPEISMWGATPWGGFGANPLPAHHQAIWNREKNAIVGGFPYSEGIFDDLNKVLYAQLYWNKNISASAIVDEYIAYEFSPKIVHPMREVIEVLERNYPRHAENLNSEHTPVKFILNQSSGAKQAFEAVQQAASHLSPRSANSWRWRILYLRALIDSELAQHGFRVSDRCEKAFRELEVIDHAQSAYYVVSPPTKKALERARRTTGGPQNKVCLIARLLRHQSDGKIH